MLGLAVMLPPLAVHVKSEMRAVSLAPVKPTATKSICEVGRRVTLLGEIKSCTGRIKNSEESGPVRMSAYFVRADSGGLVMRMQVPKGRDAYIEKADSIKRLPDGSREFVMVADSIKQPDCAKS